MEQLQKIFSRNLRRKTQEPNKSKVILHNDDVTTFDFVIRMLVEIFFFDEPDAARLAQTVDQEGQALVGIYPRDIAQSKAQAGIAMARAENFPLRITTEDA